MSTHTWKRTLAETSVVVVGCVALALAVNALRPAGLPLVARAPYEVLIPCPEPGGPVESLEPDNPVVHDERTFLIDAREVVAFGEAHLPGAVSVPYDWLDPIPAAEMKQLARRIAASRATHVVVYGDGGVPDSGEHLGREISGRGIRNVAFVRGGAPALLPGGSS